MKYVAESKFSRIFTTLVLLVLYSSNVYAKAILDPNQISGSIGFSNENQKILQLLELEGINRMWVRADSLDVEPALNNWTYTDSDGNTSSSYQLTVESSENGIRYQVEADARMTERADKRYVFEKQISSPVQALPAEGAEVTFRECAALLDIHWVNERGDAVNVDGGYVLAFQKRYQDSYYRYFLQAQDHQIDLGVNNEQLLIHGNGSEYRIDIVYEFGEDPASNKVRNICQRNITANCDEIIPIECVISGSTQLGEIRGVIEMQGEVAHDLRQFTQVVAQNGPLNNYRQTFIDGTPSSGEFVLKNLVPSAAESPAKPYIVRGLMAFGSGHHYQQFYTPYLWDYRNLEVEVKAGEQTDIGDAFKMKPSYISGEIELLGPPSEFGSSCLSALFRDADLDRDENGLPDSEFIYSSYIEAFGSNTAAAGARRSALGGQARAGYSGAFDEQQGAFRGNYRFAVAGLYGEPSRWRAGNFVYNLRNYSTDDPTKPFQWSWVRVQEQNVSEFEVAPLSEHRRDLKYCVNEVRLSYKTLSGKIFNPRASISGSFDGKNFDGQMLNYAVENSYAYGTPRTLQQASEHGVVVMCLPQGKYTISPNVSAVNPNGSVSNTELKAVSFEVGCGQEVSITTELQISLGDLPSQTNNSEITLYGQINSDANVVQMTYQNNSRAPIAICNNCGKDPKFSVDVALENGKNDLSVTAVDEHGNTSSVRTAVTYYPPVKLFNCEDSAHETARSEDSVSVDYGLHASGGCGGDITLSCDPLSGSSFPVGSTRVNCSATDLCEQSVSCEFTITVSKPFVEEPEEEEHVCRNGKVTLCHYPPGNLEAAKTLQVGIAAAVAHLEHHGDSLGACEGDEVNKESAANKEQSEDSCEIDKVSICHIPPGNPEAMHEISVSWNALKAHLDHGDALGHCKQEDKGDSSGDKKRQGPDSDGDGIADAEELEGGTDPFGRGSYRSVLKSPVYTLWNRALDMINVLELVNPGSEGAQVRLALFGINGEELESRQVYLAPQAQVDLILNDFPAFKQSPYGLLKIEFSAPIDGRVFYYRRGEGDEFEFAFNLPLSNASKGSSVVGFNTFQPSLEPSEREHVVHNWLSLVNLAKTKKLFVVKTYDQEGRLLLRRNVHVPALGRADVDGGHASIGLSVVGLHQIEPADPKTPYLAQLIRYGSKAVAGELPLSFDFAFALAARAGTGRTTYVPISSKFGEHNWLEVSNTLAMPVEVAIKFIKENGQEIWQRNIRLEAYAQKHFSAVGQDLLQPGESGFAILSPSHANSIIAESMYLLPRLFRWSGYRYHVWVFRQGSRRGNGKWFV